MKESIWTCVERQHVLRAIKIFLSERPKCPASRSTFLVYEGKKLPAKHIRGMAYQVATGKEISKKDYAGGMETVRFFHQLGFEVFCTGSVKTPNTEALLPKSSPTNETSHGQCPFPKVGSTPMGRISIPRKGAIEQKNALQLVLNRLFNGDVVCEKTFPWLKTPAEITGEYVPLCSALANYTGNTDFVKKNVSLRCDFAVAGHHLIIEYDERQHFSQARKIALETYPGIPLSYDRGLWIKACTDIQASSKSHVNRDETRAFYDSIRDMEAAQNGYRLVRIMHGQIDFEQPDAAEKLCQLLAVSTDYLQGPYARTYHLL